MSKRKPTQAILLPKIKHGPMSLVSDDEMERCLRHKVTKAGQMGRRQFVDLKDIVWKCRHVGWIRETYPHNVFDPVSVGVCSELAVSDEFIEALPAAFGAPKEQCRKIATRLFDNKEWLLDAVGYPGVSLETEVNLTNGYGDGLRYLYLHARDLCAVEDLETLLVSLKEHFGDAFPDAGELQGPYYEDEGRTEAEIAKFDSFHHQDYRQPMTTRNAICAHVGNEQAAEKRTASLRTQERALAQPY